MKRLLTAFMIAIICLLAAGCATDNVTNVEAQDSPEPIAPVVTPPMDDAPPPLETIPPEVPISQDAVTYQKYDAGIFTLDYPSHWVQVPGSNSVCFREATGEFPARMVITVKTDVGNITAEVKSKQLASFIRKVIAGFDTYNVVSAPTTGISFLGDDDSFSATYSVTKGDTTLKGYVLIAGVGKNLVVFHFRCALVDFDDMQSMCLRLRNSIVLK